MTVEPVTLEKVAWEVESLRRDFDDFRKEQRESIKGISGDVKALTFVREDVYQSDKRALEKQIEAVEKSVADNWRLTWALVALLLTAVISLLGALTRLFG